MDQANGAASSSSSSGTPDVNGSDDDNMRRTRSAGGLPPEPPMKSAYKYRPPRVDAHQYQVCVCAALSSRTLRGCLAVRAGVAARSPG